MDRELFIQMRDLEERHWWFAGRRDVLRSVIGTLGLPHAAKILEAGCGTGGNLEMLGEFGEVAAMECDDRARELASARSGIAVAKGCLPDAVPFELVRFDLIVLLDVLEHIDDDAAALKALAAVLTEEGSLLITVPAFPFLWSGHDREHHHRRRYRRHTLCTVLERAGLQVSLCSYFNFWLFGPIAIARILRRWLPERGPGADVAMPGALLNRLLRSVFGSEGRLIRNVRLPFGVSLLAVARKHPARSEGRPDAC